MGRIFYKSKKYFFSLSLIAGAFTALPAWGAEKIQFFIGPIEPTIYVEDLETFAETGEVAERFKFIANRLDSDQRDALQAFLNSRYDLDIVSTAQFAYSPVGERLLQRAGQIVQTENFLNGMKAIRASLIFAADEAASSGKPGFSPLDIIRNFPLETMQLNASLTRAIIAENEQIFRRRDRITADIQQIADAQAALASAPMPEANPAASGAYDWRVETIEFQNPARSEASLADVYYPVVSKSSDERIPVVVISHGFASSRDTFAYLAKHLSSHGYAVVAPAHIDTNNEAVSRFIEGLEGPPDPYHLLWRPQDVTAVLDTLERGQDTASNVNSLLEIALSKMNLEAVGVFGQSLGGYAVLASAGAAINRSKLSSFCKSDPESSLGLNVSILIQCRLLELPAEESLDVADSRVAAAIAINPLTSQIFGEVGLQQIQVPVMMVASTRDYFVPALPEQIEPFSWLTTENKKLVLIEPGTHFSALEASELNAFPVPSGLVGADPQQTFQQIRGLSLAFFNRHLQDQTEADLFLSQRYLNEFPEGDFQFTLVDEYPYTQADRAQVD